MTFKDVAINSFKANVKKYISYFLCSSFSIMIFFMYSTLIFNKSLSANDNMGVLEIVLPITMISIFVFAIFFINYAHSSFLNGRGKEFGIYMTLGMTNRELNKLTNIENLIIVISSLVLGLVSGSLFSRLFQMIIVKLLELKNVKFYLDFKSFLFTTVVFIIIFAVMFIISYLRSSKNDIGDFLKESKKCTEIKRTRKNNILSLTGVILLAASVIFLFYFSNKDNLKGNIICIVIYMIMICISLYLIIGNGSNALISLIKNKKIYYRNLLSINEIHYRYHENKKVLFLLSILSTVTIFLVASPFALLSVTESITNMNVNDLEYVEIQGINEIDNKELSTSVNEIDVEKINKIEILSLQLESKESTSNEFNFKPVISVSKYNEITGKDISLDQGQAINIVTDWMPGNHGISEGEKVKLTDGKNDYEFIIKSSTHDDWIGNSFPSDSGIIISDDDYEVLSNKSINNIAYYNCVTFNNWKDSEEVVNKLNNKLQFLNKDDDTGMAKYFNVSSKIESYTELKSGYSTFLFITTILGVLFFIAGASVLYFKQYNEIDQCKIRFIQLYKIGIEDKKVKKIISSELKVTFFVPLVFGTILGYCLIYMMTNMVGGEDVLKEFMKHASIVVILYFILQWLFYRITRKKYIDEIL